MIKQGRIALRHVTEADLPFLEVAMSDAVTRGEYTPSRMLGPHAVRKRFDENGYSAEDHELLLVCQEDGAVIGQVVHFTTRRYSTARELGWGIYDPALRGKGYATEAVSALVDYLFRSYPINRVECGVSVGNQASLRVAEKCGFVREGTLRGLVYVGGQYLDGDIHSILRADWEERRRNAAAPAA